MVEIEGRPLFIDNRDGNTLARAILTALSSVEVASQSASS